MRFSKILTHFRFFLKNRVGTKNYHILRHAASYFVQNVSLKQNLKKKFCGLERTTPRFMEKRYTNVAIEAGEIDVNFTTIQRTGYAK